MTKKAGKKSPRTKAEFIATIGNGKNNQIKRIAEFPLSFRDIQVTINFLTALVCVGKDAKGKKKELINQLLWNAKEKFSRLPLEKMRSLIEIYYERYAQNYALVTKNKARKSYQTFCLAHTLCGSSKGEEKFAKRLLQKIVQLFELCAFPEEGNHKDEHTKSCLLNLIAGIIALTNRTYTWANFINQLPNDEEAQRLFKVILFILLESSLYACDFYIIPHTQWNTQKDASVGLFANCLIAINYDGPIRIPVPEEHVFFVRRLKNEVIRTAEEHQKKLHKLIGWFQSNLDACSQEYDKMWTDLMDMRKPKYGLRPNGLDQIEIKIDLLRHTGYTTITLIKEGCEFPKAKALFHLEAYGCKFEIVHPLEFKPLNSPLEGNDRNLRLIDRFLIYIAMKCYWQIAMGLCNKSSSKRSGKGGGAKKDSWIVRPFFRALPKYPKPHRASAKAKARCREEFGEDPPPGYTFVSQYECTPGGQTSKPKPSIVLTCTKDDIGLPAEL